MKIVCAWCGRLQGFKCPFCGQQLIKPKTGDIFENTHMICPDCAAGTTVYFTTQNMTTTHTICEPCRKKHEHKPTSDVDTRSIAALDGYGNRGPDGARLKNRYTRQGGNK